jgi:hypothetical protein
VLIVRLGGAARAVRSVPPGRHSSLQHYWC